MARYALILMIALLTALTVAEPRAAEGAADPAARQIEVFYALCST